MSTERECKSNTYGISDNRYRELKYFCRQYREKQGRLRAISSALRGSGRTADGKQETLERELALIEQTAMETDAVLYPYLLRHIADGTPWEYLQVPYSRATFYRRKKKFFWLLDQRKN